MFQQAWDLKPSGRDGAFLFEMRHVILASGVMEVPPFRALSPYAATFFPQSPCRAISTRSQVNFLCVKHVDGTCMAAFLLIMFYKCQAARQS